MLADQIFHLGHVLIRHLDARAGGNFEIDGELARIRLRKERQTEKRINRQATTKMPTSTLRSARTLQRPPDRGS